MQKPKKQASDKAKANLFRQQIILLDMVEELTKGDDAGWESYFHSVAPEFLLLEEKPGKKATRNLSITFMRYFRDSVCSGATPSAAVLIHVAECFDKYLNDDSGMLSLDEAFKLSHRPRLGNPIKQEQWLQNKMTILLAMWLQRKINELKGNKLSIENAAGIIIDKWNLDEDAESLKKAYIKSKIDKEYEGRYYPPTSEVIRDLENAFEDATLLHISGIIPKSKSVLNRMESKNGLKVYLSSCIEQLGNK